MNGVAGVYDGGAVAGYVGTAGAANGAAGGAGVVVPPTAYGSNVGGGPSDGAEYVGSGALSVGGVVAGSE